jgi:hypothetical protein
MLKCSSRHRESGYLVRKKHRFEFRLDRHGRSSDAAKEFLAASSFGNITSPDLTDEQPAGLAMNSQGRKGPVDDGIARYFTFEQVNGGPQQPAHAVANLARAFREKMGEESAIDRVILSERSKP